MIHSGERKSRVARHQVRSLIRRNQGDSLDTSIILWTRAVPLPASNGELPIASIPVCVSYKIATDENLGQSVDTGEAFTTYDVDFTVKVEAKNLKPDTKYWYQFADCTNEKTVSPIGMTRTLSSADTPAEEVNNGNPLTFAVFSCSNFAAGYFNAYGFAAHNVTPDVFIHLGDYMYEDFGNGGSIGRLVLGRELATIADYRHRFEQYRSDLDLQFAHQTFPWITDDHEIANNGWKAGTSDSNDTASGCMFSPSGACFTDRKMAGTRAYHEWMPIRQVDAKDQLRIWRNFQIGKLLDLTMLDTRELKFRSFFDFMIGFMNAIKVTTTRSIMGHSQENWLSETLSQSKSREAIWRVIGQQVVFTQLLQNTRKSDAWDGYRSNRNRILDQLYGKNIDNTVILSGDSHANWVSDLAHINDTETYDPLTGSGAIGVEFAGTGVTSSSGTFKPNGPLEFSNNVSMSLVQENIDLQWSEGHFRGFFTIRVTPEFLNATYYSMQNATFRNLDGFASANFSVKAGANRLTRPVANGNILSGALKPGNH
ncbi:hypothetical protein AGABI2DRAFT_72252 [Agaricus bisporus var. bisporus H97]|uniref:hypothetical protein n=1 Tax=Agaricus bisporus var. bisporus (strain H97 / ATCC MYA-4626 / FGSC 10389) TaxID=936046 RepID=UPI00029F58E1|nr:hypothetical protein AGABI2DRAFT_72252 [Agaricus bisporus var. bisporus H97]EKV46041.1 hypothetical protein AGABI2DRAFT_72252 [Agaricus bisporus var. bisporus H97]